jgi:tRNA A37 threonylcarbamoyltransferase TsaD
MQFAPSGNVIMCRERDAKSFVPERQFCVDNGSMIAWLGILEGKKRKTAIKDSGIKPYWRTDEA